MATTLVNLSDKLADLAADVRRSLVRIRNGRQGEGAGSVWHPDGLIVTNAHVVGSDNLRVTLADGRDLPARVLARSAEHDLAALAVEADDLTSISLGQSEHLRAGQLVLAMGHPWGVSDAVTSGAVIGVGPGLPETPAAGRDWIAAGLRLRPGNSGGPMMDDQGRLVGINTMMTGCRWSTIMSVVNRSGKMSVHERIDIDPERTGKAPSAQRYPGRSDISG